MNFYLLIIVPFPTLEAEAELRLFAVPVAPIVGNRTVRTVCGTWQIREYGRIRTGTTQGPLPPNDTLRLMYGYGTAG
jgi:hypothetical protein